MGFHVQENIKIARRPPIQPRFTFTPHAQAGTFIHTGGDLHRNHLFFFHSAMPMTGGTGASRHFTLAAATGTSTGNGEKALGGTDLACSFAGGADHPSRTRFGAGTVAGLAS